MLGATLANWAGQPTVNIERSWPLLLVDLCALAG